MSNHSEFSICPFSIVVDSNEGAPYPFAGLTERGPKKRPIAVKVIRRPLWSMTRRDVEIKGQTFNVGLADYTIEGMESQIQIERKSLSDLFSTLGSRRNKFEAEIKRLHEDCQYAEVVVEADWTRLCLWKGPGPAVNSVVGTIKAWQQRYPGVHWNLYPSRAASEKFVFRALERFWNDNFKASNKPIQGDLLEGLG